MLCVLFVDVPVCELLGDVCMHFQKCMLTPYVAIHACPLAF